MRSISAILLLLGALPALAEEAGVPDDVTACMHRNVPEVDTIRAVRINTRDATGGERVTVVRVYSRRGEAGLRQVLVEFREPEELRGSSVLLFEREGPNEVYLRPGPGRAAKRINLANRSLPFLGTDFSYEDFERLLAFRRPDQVTRLADDRVNSRPVYVIESRPEQGDSIYDRVVSFIDHRTCVPLRIELFERDKGLRKRLTVDPMLLKKKGKMWLPQLALMEDMLNFTSTVLMVDSTRQDEPLSDDLFALPALQ